MKINLSRSYQCAVKENEIKGKMYKKLYVLSTKKGGVCLLGFPVGVISGVLTVSARIGLIGENALKGVANICGAPFFKSCHAKLGAKQLFWHSFYHLCVLPFSAGSAIFGVFSKTFMTLVNPTSYFYDKWCQHDANEWNARAMRIQVNEAKEEKIQLQRELEAKRVEQQRLNYQKEQELNEKAGIILPMIDQKIVFLKQIKEGIDQALKAGELFKMPLYKELRSANKIREFDALIRTLLGETYSIAHLKNNPLVKEKLIEFELLDKEMDLILAGY